MPDLATMQAARPKCPALIDVALHDAAPGEKLLVGQQRCDEPMRWSPGVEAWVCPLHGRIENDVSVYAAAIHDA